MYTHENCNKGYVYTRCSNNTDILYNIQLSEVICKSIAKQIPKRCIYTYSTYTCNEIYDQQTASVCVVQSYTRARGKKEKLPQKNRVVVQTKKKLQKIFVFFYYINLFFCMRMLYSVCECVLSYFFRLAFCKRYYR